MLTEIRDVRRFHEAMRLPAPKQHTLLTEEARQRRWNLITEEANELLASDKPVDQLDAVIDLLYVVIGTAIEMGLAKVDVCDAWFKVHKSNMAKLGPDGPIYREDGKLLKPEGWQPPNLNGIFRPQQ